MPQPAPNNPERRPPGIALLPLLAAIAIMLALSVRPDLLAKADGRPDQMATALLCWAMAAGFVRGVGFVPRLRIWRWMLGTPACILGIALAIWRLLG